VTPRKGFNCSTSGLSILEDDQELKLITAKKMAAMKRRAQDAAAVVAANAQKPAEKTSREVLNEFLFDRGDEVLEAAYNYYPSQTDIVVDQLADYLKSHPQTEKIRGGELYAIFRKIGIRFPLNTTIKVQERGKFIDLKDKLKIKKIEEEESG
jgi:DNA-binding TFAR19-related protein (PDSD5 family)